jgi:beta-lactamase class A
MRNRVWMLTVGCSLLLGLATPARAQNAALQAAYRAKMQSQLSAVADHLNGVMGYVIKDLKTGESFDRNPDVVFPQASSIKLTILLELLRQDQEGKLSLDEKHTIRRSETVGGDAIIYLLGDGTVTMTWRDLATFMVVLSDNSATNMLIDRVGMANVNAEVQRLGLTQTKLRRRMMDLQAAQQGNENVSTPREMALLLEKVHAGQALDPAHTREYFRLLELPKESEFHAALPDTVQIADKPGSLEAVRCDTGVVEIPGHPFVISVMTTYLADEGAGERAIEQVARLAYDYFDRLARSSAYGRIISEK